MQSSVGFLALALLGVLGGCGSSSPNGNMTDGGADTPAPNDVAQVDDSLEPSDVAVRNDLNPLDDSRTAEDSLADLDGTAIPNDVELDAEDPDLTDADGSVGDLGVDDFNSVDSLQDLADPSDVVPLDAVDLSVDSLPDVIVEPQFKEFSSGGITFRWAVVGEELWVELEAQTTGWVAVGFEPTDAMKDANFILGYVKPDGTVALRDDFGTTTESHGSDVSLGGTDDVSQESGTELAGVTVVKFVMPLDSGDAFDKALVPGTMVDLILGAGPNGLDNFTSTHSKLGVGSIVL